MTKKLRITQRRSAIGRQKRQKLTLKALGIRKMNQCVVHNNTPQIRGMVKTVEHLVDVEEVS